MPLRTRLGTYAICGIVLLCAVCRHRRAKLEAATAREVWLRARVFVPDVVIICLVYVLSRRILGRAWWIKDLLLLLVSYAFSILLLLYIRKRENLRRAFEMVLTSASQALRSGSRKGTAILALISLFICLSILEFGCRKIFKGVPYFESKGSEFVFDSKLGWRARPGLSLDATYGRYPLKVPVSINRDGFRDDDWDKKLKLSSEWGAKRILVLGDSIAYGWGIPNSDRFGEQLERVYKLNHKRAVVFTAAIPGFSTSQEYRLLPEVVKRIHPNIVIQVFCGNDYADTALPYDHTIPARRRYRPFYDENGNLVLNAKVPKTPSLYFSDTPFAHFGILSALDQLFYAVEDYQYAKMKLVPRRVAASPDFENIVWDESFLKRYPYVEGTVAALLAKTQTYVQQHGARYYYINVPSPVYERLTNFLGKKFPIVRPPGNYPIWWYSIPMDGHPNFLWGWLTAKDVFKQLEGKTKQFPLSWARTKPVWPNRLDLNRLRNLPYLAGNWRKISSLGAQLDINKPGGIFLNGPKGNLTVTVQAKVVGRGTATLTMETPGGGKQCTEPLGADWRKFACSMKSAKSLFLVSFQARKASAIAEGIIVRTVAIKPFSDSRN